MADAFQIDITGLRGIGGRFASANQAGLAAARVEFRAFAGRVLDRARSRAPHGPEGEGWHGPHLADDLVLLERPVPPPVVASYQITAGSDRGQAVLRYVTGGTRAHDIRPRAGGVLRFASRGGDTVFTRVAHHPGTAPNPFLQEAVRDEDVQGEARQLAGRFVTGFRESWRTAATGVGG
jgi:hypothetical protein